MIIDSHIHIGKIVKFNMPEAMVLESMEKYGVDFSLASNIEGCEVDCEQSPIPLTNQFGQIELNEKLIRFVRSNPKKLGALLWCKVGTEGCTKEFENLIIKNRDIIYGLKVHPYHSKVPFNSPKVEKYIEIARKYSLAVVTHTAMDYESSPELVYDMALKYPDVNFVMYHMGLGTDNEKAIELISKLPNLYGDTAWVKPDKVLKAIEVCGANKIIFGTDNPIDGVDTYNHDFYKFDINDMKSKISKEDYEKLMFKNAINLFKIKIQN